MKDYQEYFQWSNVAIGDFYAYFVIAALISAYLAFKSGSANKVLLFILSFFIITGNLNDILTFKIPGVQLFEIQPVRFIFLVLLFYLIKDAFFSGKPLRFSTNFKIPWFVLALGMYMFFILASVAKHFGILGAGEALLKIYDLVVFVVLILGIKQIADPATYKTLGKIIIITAVLTSLVSLVQIAPDSYFLRIGDARPAFGNVLRTNGIFDAEYYNSYFLIIATVWTFVILKNDFWKWGLIALFTIGVFTTFHRMSWLIHALVLFTILVFIQKVGIGKLVVLGLSIMALTVSIYTIYNREIMNSSLVKERLNDHVDGRKGYYQMVLNNIDKKPVLGFGSLQNEVYYQNMLRITGSRERANASVGGLHSGYFESMFIYGIPAFVAFVFFVVLAVLYFSRSVRHSIYYAIPFMASIIYALGNLTNGFLILSYLSVLYALHIGVGMGINKMSREAESSETAESLAVTPTNVP